MVPVFTCVWWVSLRQDQVLEVNDADGLSSEPAVRHHLDVVLRRQRLKDGDGEDEVLRFSCHHLVGEQTPIIMSSLEGVALTEES